MPVYNSVPLKVKLALNALYVKPPCPVRFVYRCGDSLVSRVRNDLAADFLDTDYTHCLWWDSDIIATPDQVARLLSHDEAIVGGLYANKSERRLKWVLNPFGETTPIDNRGVIPVRHIGTGFLLVAREVLFLAVPRAKRLKGCMARIVPNHWAFGKRNDSRVTR
jgi:hypothetical protein